MSGRNIIEVRRYEDDKMKGIIMTVLILSGLFTLSLQSSSSSCQSSMLSNECIDFILHDPQGPQLMPLMMELTKADKSTTKKVVYFH